MHNKICKYKWFIRQQLKIQIHTSSRPIRPFYMSSMSGARNLKLGEQQKARARAHGQYFCVSQMWTILFSCCVYQIKT